MSIFGSGTDNEAIKQKQKDIENLQKEEERTKKEVQARIAAEEENQKNRQRQLDEDRRELANRKQSNPA